MVEVLELLPPDAPVGAAGDPEYVALVDELGDLLYQIVFHVILAEEAGAFTMAEVARGIHDKLVRRHPHVFGDAAAGTGDDVLRNWEQIKKEEKGHDSLVAGLTPGLPSLLYTHKLYRKAASAGLDPGGLEPSRRPRARRRGRDRRGAERPGRAAPSRAHSASCSRPPSRCRAPGASTPSPRCGVGRAGSASASSASRCSPASAASTSARSIPRAPRRSGRRRRLPVRPRVPADVR